MLTTNSEGQVYDRWYKLQRRCCCLSGKTPLYIWGGNLNPPE